MTSTRLKDYKSEKNTDKPPLTRVDKGKGENISVANCDFPRREMYRKLFKFRNQNVKTPPNKCEICF